jgi:plastocyanin
MMSVSARRPARLALLAAVLGILGATLLLGPGGAAAHAAAAAPAGKEIDGTAQLKWEPANLTIKPGDSVNFVVKGSPPHPVGSGSNPPTSDNRFDASACGLAKMSTVGASCTVKFPKAGTYPFFCSVHFASGMKGVITVGSGGSATATTAGAGGGAASATTAVAITTPPTAAGPTAGRPSVYWAGAGLLALGGLLTLAAIAGYLRFAPGWRRR